MKSEVAGVVGFPTVRSGEGSVAVEVCASCTSGVSTGFGLDVCVLQPW